MTKRLSIKSYSKKYVPIVSNPCFELWPYLHFQMRESGFGSPQHILKALKKLPGFENYDKDGVQISNITFLLIEAACKRASELVLKQHDNPKEDPFTNVHILVNRLKALKEQQNYFDKTRRQ